MNMIKKYTGRSLWLGGLMLTTLIAGCGGGSSSSSSNPITTPTVVETAPKDGAIDVALNSKVVVTFSEAMDGNTITTESFTVTDQAGTALNGTVVYDGDSKTASFDSGTTFFTANTDYTAKVTTMAASTSGIPLAGDYEWTFTSGATDNIDATAPTVTSTYPIDGSGGFPLNRNVTANFSESIDPVTVNDSTFILSIGSAAGGTPVSGTVSYSDKVATFDPTNDLATSTWYTATLTTDIKDLADIGMAANKEWSFQTGTTASAVALGPEAVNLRTAGDFVILTKSGITNTGAHLSNITGNIGSSPIAASAMNDVWCEEMVVPSKIYGSDASYTGQGTGFTDCFIGGTTLVDGVKASAYVSTAVGDMGTAYGDAKDRTDPDFTELHAGDLSGKELVPGLYKWSSSVLINTDVTLKGGPNDVWIFQIAGDLTQASGGDLATGIKVILEGGALPENVFWQVAGGAGVEVGAYATFEGIVLAATKVVVKTGAAVNGRLFAHTAVTLDENPVTQP